MKRCCSNCGWLEANQISAMFCGYSEKHTWADESCLAWKPKDEPKTNADRIRAMTDEELAEWIARHMYCEECMNFDSETGLCNYKNRYGGCNGAMLEWLKQEVTE